MNKIGIVSRVHGVNYGANLQAIALQQCLKSLGAESEYINYELDPTSKGLHSVLSFGFGIVRKFLGYNKRLQRTNAFRNRFMTLSTRVDSYDQLCELSSQYGLLLAGSDQIWNPRYLSVAQGTYLLDFNNQLPKYSYASSFGITTLPEKFREYYKKRLSHFEALSVREEIGVNILQQLGIRAECHIDPTFLLERQEWKNYFPEYSLRRKPYVCCYVMQGADDLNKYIIEQTIKLRDLNYPNCEVVVLGEKEYKGFFSRSKYCKTAGPSEFLNLIYNAEYVLTSSFHGTCFSVIFNKAFNSVLSQSNQFNSRIENLLKKLNLNNRISYKEEPIKIGGNIDFSYANYVIEKEKKIAFGYLKSMLSR